MFAIEKPISYCCSAAFRLASELVNGLRGGVADAAGNGPRSVQNFRQGGISMRRLMMALAITAVAGAGSLIGGSAQALPGVAGLPGAHDAGLDSGLVEQAQM